MGTFSLTCLYTMHLVRNC